MALTARLHHLIGFRFRKKPPVGPSSGKVASQTAVSAPSSGLRDALSPPMRVRTHPGHIAFTLRAARERMLRDGIDATSAAYEVGYESVSQFNREYSRFFGQPPMRDIKALREGRVIAIDAA